MRELGFYWVRTIKGWEIAKFSKDNDGYIWELYWYYDFIESDFFEIDENRIIRQPVCKDELLSFKGIILTGEPIKKAPK